MRNKVKLLWEKRLTYAFNIICSLLFLFLNLISFLHSCANPDNLEDEHVYMYNDSKRMNTVWLFLMLLTIFLLYYLCKRYMKSVNCNLIAGIVIISMTIFSVYWVHASNTAPQSDQLTICNIAEEFNHGNYYALKKGSYVAICPHQLGLITFTRLIFALFGDGNYKAYQYFSAVMVSLLVYSGYLIVGKLSEQSKSARIYYLIFTMTCIPLYIYVPFVYGEIVSTAIIMLEAYLLISYTEHFSWGKLVGLGICAGVAVQLRQNTIIIVIGFLVAIMVKLCSGLKRDYILGGISIMAGVIILQATVDGIYHEHITDEDKTQIPAILYVAMGTNDDMGFAGWYNSYLDLYEESGYDTELSSQIAKKDIESFVEKCRKNPAYAYDFYKRKINYQWNAPMYQSLAINNYLSGQQSMLAHEVYYGKLRDYCEAFMNMHHLIMYFGVLLFLLDRLRKQAEIEKYALLIGIFGGFLFTLFWETKTRYGFPYYVMMTPFAAVGLYNFMKWAVDIIETHKKIA